MRYLVEPRDRMYIQEYSTLSFAKSAAKKFGDKYGKKIMNTAKTAKATGDLIGNRIADKITSVGKKDTTESHNKISETQENYIPTENHQQVIDDLRFI